MALNCKEYGIPPDREDSPAATMTPGSSRRGSVSPAAAGAGGRRRRSSVVPRSKMQLVRNSSRIKFKNRYIPHTIHSFFFFLNFHNICF